MTERCHTPAELADLTGLPVDDPRRRHLNSCPRCRGLAEAQGLFLEPGATSDLQNFAEADAELAARLEKELATAPPASPKAGRRNGWYAMAAVLAVCALGLATSEVMRLRSESGPRVGQHVRGDAAAGLAVSATGESLEGTWSSAPEAETFVLVLMDRNLAEVGRLSSDQPAFTAAKLPALAAFCQAFAVSYGDTVGRSGIVALRPARE